MRAVSIVLALTAALCGAATAQPQDRAADGERVIVFFAWDRPAIDGDAAALLDKVAESVREAPGVRILVAGHADRSGPAQPNLRAGLMRAEAVRDYLAARGVPAAAMTTVSHGESRPLIATADGVREPQNRRVEIVTSRTAGN